MRASAAVYVSGARLSQLRRTPVLLTRLHTGRNGGRSEAGARAAHELQWISQRFGDQVRSVDSGGKEMRSKQRDVFALTP